MVLVLKILSFVSFVVFGIQDQILRHGLYLLPVYVLEGWVIAQLMLMALYGYEREERAGEKKIIPPPEDFERNVKASMIVYVLTKLAFSFVVGMTFEGEQAMPDTAAPPPSFQTFLMAFTMLVFSIWSFRFFWLYIPYVMGRGPWEYLMRFKPFMSSFFLIGVWVLCFVPLALLMIVASKFLVFVLGILGLGDVDIVVDSVLGALQGVIDYAMALVSSIGVAYGMYSVFADEDKTTEIW